MSLKLSQSHVAGPRQKRQKQNKIRAPARSGGIAGTDSSASLGDSSNTSNSGAEVAAEVDDSEPDGVEGEQEDDEEEQEEEEGEGQARYFADAGYVSSTFSCSHVTRPVAIMCPHILCLQVHSSGAEGIGVCKEAITEGQHQQVICFSPREVSGPAWPLLLTCHALSL